MESLNFEDLDKYLLKQDGKIIHQIWFGIIPNKRAALKDFEKLKKYRNSWLIKNPGWTYVCWNLSLCKDLVNNYYSHHKEMYDKYPYHIQRCDTVRYFILHRYGGLYADMDYYCNQSWDDVIEKYNHELYLVETPNKVGYDTHISNSLMYSSKPGHVFWSKLFIELEQNQTAPMYYGRHMTIMFTTGPGILNHVFTKNRLRFYLNYYPFELFHPHGLNSDILTINDKPEIYALHLGKGSWESNDSKWLIFIYQEYKLILSIILIMIIPHIINNIIFSIKMNKD